MTEYKIWGGERSTTRMIINRLKECGISCFFNALAFLEYKNNYLLVLVPHGSMWCAYLSSCHPSIYNTTSPTELLYNQITPEYLQRLLINEKGI